MRGCSKRKGGEREREWREEGDSIWEKEEQEGGDEA